MIARNTADPSPPRREPKGPIWLRAALLLAMALLAHWPATQGGFIWDDDFNVTENLPLRTLEGLGWLWTTPGATTQYYPLVYTSFWLEHAAWGFDPFGYHVVNLLLHGAVAIGMWRCLVVLSVPGAWFAAAIFAVHPIHVETVAWVTERKNLLSLLFYLVSAWAYLTWIRPDARRAKPGPGRYAAALALYFAALLSKVTAVILPPALLVIAWWQRGRLDRRDWISVAPMFALAVPIGLLTRSLESELGSALRFEWDPTPVERVLLASRAATHYLEKLVWPADLTFVYPRWEIDTLSAGYAALWLVLLGVGFALRNRIGRAPLAACLFFLGSLAPMLGLLEIYYFRFSFVADHWVYAASIAPISLFAAWATHQTGSSRGIRRVGGGLLLLALGASTWQYSHAFRDSETLWRDSLSKNPDSWLAQFNLGRELQRQGRDPEAIAPYQRAAEIDPDHPDAFSNLGLIWSQRGELARAIEAHRTALGIEGAGPKLHWNLGIALQRAGRFDEGLPHLERGLAPHPGQLNERTRLTRAHARLANLFRRHGDPERAIDHYRKSLDLDPAQPEVHLDRGRLLLAAGDTQAAAHHFETALRLDPSNARAAQLLERAHTEQ